MPKRKGPEPKPEGQFKEFVKTARELGVDESGEALDRVFKKPSPFSQAFLLHLSAPPYWGQPASSTFGHISVRHKNCL